MTPGAVAFGRGGGWGGGGHFVGSGLAARGFAINRGSLGHPFRRAFAFRRVAFRKAFAFGGGGPYYGYGYVPTDAFGDIDTASYPETVGFVMPEPLHASVCRRSEETVTVPSEDGGTRQIKVIRCP
jgi:hypothetical protein